MYVGTYLHMGNHLNKGIFTGSVFFMSHHVVRHDATKLRINPNCAAWCHMTQRDTKLCFMYVNKVRF
jgi:hypothetical protein